MERDTDDFATSNMELPGSHPWPWEDPELPMGRNTGWLGVCQFGPDGAEFLPVTPILNVLPARGACILGLMLAMDVWGGGEAGFHKRWGVAWGPRAGQLDGVHAHFPRPLDPPLSSSIRLLGTLS